MVIKKINKKKIILCIRRNKKKMSSCDSVPSGAMTGLLGCQTGGRLSKINSLGGSSKKSHAKKSHVKKSHVKKSHDKKSHDKKVHTKKTHTKKESGLKKV